MNNDQMNNASIQQTLGIGTKKKSRRRWLWLVLILLVAGGAAYFFVSKNGNKKVEYVTAPVEKKDLIITVSATGNLEPTNTVDVGIEVSGTVSEVYADYNQRVKEGDVLARLDTTKLESRVKNTNAALLVAKANLSESKVALADAKKELARGTEMYESTKGNFPSEKEMDALRNAYNRAVASHDAAVARVAQADAQLKSDQDDLKKAVVVSPFDGIVLSRAIDPGQTVAASLQTPVLFTLAEDLTKMEVVVSVDEADVGQVKEGQKVTFTVDAYPGKTFDGTITQVRLNSVIVSGVVTYETVVSVANKELLLRPGMTASADIITKVVKDALVVPNAALRFMPPGKTAEGIKNGVWVLDEKKQPKRIEVTTEESDGIVTAVNNGLTEETEVITGTKVKKNGRSAH